MKRRDFLQRSLALGCSLAASPFVTPVTVAAAPGEARLVVLILRGGMDGLDVVQPRGAPDYAALRPDLSQAEATDLDGFFALHHGFAELMPMWRAGELAFAHAVSTPYRDKRSHFDGQDLLEAGTAALQGAAGRDGWLNRMLQTVPGVHGQTAYAIGREDLLLTTGAAPVAQWAPEADLDLSPQARLLLDRMYAADPAMHAALRAAIDIADDLGLAAEGGAVDDGAMMQSMMQAVRRGGMTRIIEFAVDRLRAESRIAAFSVNGWDTHHNQARSFLPAAGQLTQVLTGLRDGLGPAIWERTAVLAMTEFGRTARQNGSGGTDHGTGGAMILAGGAVRGGKVYGDWPGLAESDLYQGRDLAPTADVRSYAAAVMQGLFGLDRNVLEGSVFPELDMGQPPRVIL